MLIVMVVAGAVCGLCIARTYGCLFDEPSIGSWIGYNMLDIVMSGLLGAASAVVFEPVTTLAASGVDDTPTLESLKPATDHSSSSPRPE